MLHPVPFLQAAAVVFRALMKAFSLVVYVFCRFSRLWCRDYSSCETSSKKVAAQSVELPVGTINS